jgi:hypothetical protein
VYQQGLAHLPATEVCSILRSLPVTIACHVLNGEQGHSIPTVQHLCARYASLFHCRTMAQFLWHDDIVSVAKFSSDDGLDIMLGADSNNESQTSYQV